MVDRMTMVDPTPMVVLIPMVDPILMVVEISIRTSPIGYLALAFGIIL